MFQGMTVGVVIPARDEQGHIGTVVAGLLALIDPAGRPVVDQCVVCDNGSADATAQRARDAGARVAPQPTPGYGIACLTAIDALEPADVVIFIDGDGSFRAGQAIDLLAAIAAGADLVIGSRTLGAAEPGALSPPQRIGNRVAALLVKWLWRRDITDLGPFRAIRGAALERLRMQDRAFGWTVEMQVKAIQQGLRIAEVPVDTLRRRFGKSKVGGTLRGVIGASIGILSTIALLRWHQRQRPARRLKEDESCD